jgi:hypothetical protein
MESGNSAWPDDSGENMDTNSDLMDWIKTSDHDWARRMAANLIQYGSLTRNQLEASARIMTNSLQPKPEAQQEELNIGAIEAAFARAKQVIKKPKMTLKNFTFKCAPEHGKNPGAIYITQSDNDQYLGKVLNGQFSLSRDCTPEQLEQIKHIAADPRQAAIAHGKEWGICCVCNRTLTDPESVANGIGPICAERFGW